MVLLVSPGISRASSESAGGGGVSCAFWAGFSHRFGGQLATGWSRMASDDTSDDPETLGPLPHVSHPVAG